MSETATLRVRGWERFQHYKKRTPPWIKLYNDLLENYDFAVLPDASKAHIVSIWLLASRMENSIPADASWVARKINATDPVDLSALIGAGFLEVCGNPASETLAACKQSARPEGEREGERKQKQLPSEREKAPVSDLWEMWLRRFGGSGRQPTLTAARSKALKKLWDEQLKDDDDPFGTFSKVLEAVKASDHHMSKREYQFPDSLFRNDSRRDRWVDIAVNGQVPNGNGSNRGFWG